MTTEEAIISGVIPAHTSAEKDILIRHLKDEVTRLDRTCMRLQNAEYRLTEANKIMREALEEIDGVPVPECDWSEALQIVWERARAALEKVGGR